MCDNCGYKTEVVTYTDGMPRREFKLCHICANTFLAKAVIWPRQCKDISLYQSIGWIANYLMEAIREGRLSELRPQAPSDGSDTGH